MGLVCILLSTTNLLVLALPWNRWCLRRNYFQVLMEDAILEQTEKILRSETGRAAAETVTGTLLTGSAPKTAQPPHLTNVHVKGEKNEIKEEVFLNLNVNWKKVAYIAGRIIDTIPNDPARDDNRSHCTQTPGSKREMN